jgi:inorganic pyrophosphatase
MKFPKAFTKEGTVNVIIETPYKTRNKLKYDKVTGLFKLSKVIPSGLEFPCDMGFIPNTKGEDGDPLDALILMDEITYPGCLIECRLLGAIKATQKEKGKKKMENDRFILVPSEMSEYDHLKNINDLNQSKIRSISEFFKDYNKKEGKKFKLVGIINNREAEKLIRKNTKRKIK